MGKISFVFSGQGAQYGGMGKSLCESSKAAADVFARLDAIRPGTSELCFNGTTEELSRTENTQPCMFAVELAAYEALREAGIACDMTAGFSLGEIAALTACGAVGLEEGFRIVSRRGELMARDAAAVESGMYAVVKLPPEKTEELCAAYEHVYPVNYNSPGQVSVAGLKDELALFSKDVRAAGGRAIPLKVAGAFHSPLMNDASRDFGELLAKVEFSKPAFPLYSDCTAQPYDSDFAVMLQRQIVSPVKWQAIVEDMHRCGVDTFVELGPGKTLCGLISKTLPDVKVLHVEDAESLAETIQGVQAC